MAILRRTSVIDGKLVVEEIEDPNLITVKKKERMKGGDFIFVFQKAILEVLKNGNLTKNEHKILLYLIAKTEFEKEINATLYGIAKELKIDQSNASRAMEKLESISIVIRNKSLKTFRLNYEIGFKGSPKNYKKLQFTDKPLLSPIESKQTDIFTQLEELKNKK